MRLIAKSRRLLYALAHGMLRKKVTHPGVAEYVKWLSFSNAGMMDEGNIYAIKHALDNLPSENPVLEIGSFCGLSTNVITHVLETCGRSNKVITCDKWEFEGTEPDSGIGNSRLSHARYREFVKWTYMNNVEFFSAQNLPYTIEVFSDEFFRLWAQTETVDDVFGRPAPLGGPVSFCYVDGNHTYEYAGRDFRNLDHFLEPGGYVLFDDSFDSNPFGLTRLMREIQHHRGYELVMKNPNYLFTKIG
jgi:hypothetical protein